MTAELRQIDGSTFVVDVECDLDEDWGDDVTGADVRRAEHNEAAHPLSAAGASTTSV